MHAAPACLGRRNSWTKYNISMFPYRQITWSSGRNRTFYSQKACELTRALWQEAWEYRKFWPLFTPVNTRAGCWKHDNIWPCILVKASKFVSFELPNATLHLLISTTKKCRKFTGLTTTAALLDMQTTFLTDFENKNVSQFEQCGTCPRELLVETFSNWCMQLLTAVTLL